MESSSPRALRSQTSAELAVGELDAEAKANVIPANLAIRRPRRMMSIEWLNGTDRTGLPVGDAAWHRRRGFDGIVIAADLEFLDPLFHADTFAVFSNFQVRSALTHRPL